MPLEREKFKTLGEPVLPMGLHLYYPHLRADIARLAPLERAQHELRQPDAENTSSMSSTSTGSFSSLTGFLGNVL